MKEYYFQISGKELSKGMYPGEPHRNSGFLENLNGMVCTEDGIEPYIPIIDPLTLPITFDFPFPQLFVGKKQTLLAGETILYDVGRPSWIPSQLTTYDRGTIVEKPIVAGGPWHFADFWKTWVLFNGSCLIFKQAMPLPTGLTPRLIVIDDTRVETGCAFKGRLMMGGFEPENFWYQLWQTIREEWAAGFPGNWQSIETVGENFVFWSSIGGGDAFYLFLAEIAMSGTMGDDIGYNSSNPIWDTFLKRNEWGLMPMPWQGKVRCMKPLGDAVMVYGDDGISALIPASSPTPTFGLKHILNVGIASRGAVGGDDSEHLFIDNGGSAWTISGDLVAKRLGYQHHIASFSPANIIVAFNPHRKHFTISDEYHGLLVSKNGMSRPTQIVSSMFYVDGMLIGTRADTGIPGLQLTTEAFDMGLRGIKRIEAIELGTDADANMNVAVMYRYKKYEPFEISDWVEVNDEGNAYIGMCGVEFKILINCNSSSNISLDYVGVRWKLMDKRMIRGLYVAETPA